MKLKVLVFLMFAVCNIYSQQVVDKIVAVVDNDIILESELDYQTQLYAAQNKIDPNLPGLKKQILNTMIDDKLVYAQATFDSIKVS